MVMVKRYFGTQPEADAFVEGVKFASSESTRVIGEAVKCESTRLWCVSVEIETKDDLE